MLFQDITSFNLDPKHSFARQTFRESSKLIDSMSIKTHDDQLALIAKYNDCDIMSYSSVNTVVLTTGQIVFIARDAVVEGETESKTLVGLVKLSKNDFIATSHKEQLQ